MNQTSNYRALLGLLKMFAVVATLATLTACSSDDKPAKTYTLSGNASGLSGAVKLKANTETLTVAANGSFSFSTEWEDKTTVNLSITTAPEGQTCTVAPQQVTFAGADINNVAVSCEDIVVIPTFAMQLSVSGNERDLSLSSSINGTDYSHIVGEGDTELAPLVSPGDVIKLSLNAMAGHTCTITPSEFVVAEEAPAIDISCTTFGSVSVLVTNYQTAMPIVNGTVNAYVFSGAEGAAIEDENAYTLLDSVETNDEGRVTVKGVGYQERLVMQAIADGYSTRSDVGRTSVENPSTSVSIAMISVDAEVTFDGAQETTVTVENSPLSVTVPANGFVDADGYASTDITARLTNIDGSSDPDIMPGEYEAYDPVQGTIQQIESFGAINASFVNSSGNAVNLAEGVVATARIPLAERATNPPATVPLIYFNELTGIWGVEGQATLKTDANSGAKYYEGDVKHFSFWNAAVLYNSVRINGCVFEEDNETPRRNVRIRAEGVDYIGRSTAYTDNEGNYSIQVRPNSRLLISVNDASGISTTFPVQVGATDLTLPECVVAIQGAMRVTLTWGANPSDLDTHLMGPTVPNGTVSSERFRVYYANRKETVNGVTIDLDVDDVTSYGPEVTTVPAFPYPGVYRYAVHHYSGSGTIFQSPTRVELQVNGENYVFAPSEDANSGSSSTNTWIAFDVTVAEDGSVSVLRVDRYVPRSGSDIWANGMPPEATMQFPVKQAPSEQ